MVSSAYLRLVVFLLSILIPACASSSPPFSMMYSVYKLNKQSDNIQPCHTPFPILNQSIVLCPVLIVTPWPTYKFLRRQARWSGIPIFLKNFHSLLWSTPSTLELMKNTNDIKFLVVRILMTNEGLSTSLSVYYPWRRSCIYCTRDRPQLRVRCIQRDSKGEEIRKACHQHLPGTSARVLGP